MNKQIVYQDNPEIKKLYPLMFAGFWLGAISVGIFTYVWYKQGRILKLPAQW